MKEGAENLYAELKARVDALRKNGRLPYWRLSYAEFSLSRIGDYIAVRREGEALEMGRRLSSWLDSHERELAKTEKPVPAKVPLWNSASIERGLDEIRKKLQAKNYLIPVAERISFANGMDRAKKLLSQSKCDAAYAELFSLRTQLVSRLHRSYRARAAMILYSRHAPGFGRSPKGEVVGPYNAERTLESALSLVGERDAIWVEDFFELYEALSQMTERLSPVEKKRR